MYTSLHEVTKEILESLTPREAKVLRMRFGIDMNTDHTLEEVGRQFDVTRERIRQIEAKALRKLRHPTRSDRLRSFLTAKTASCKPKPQVSNTCGFSYTINNASTYPTLPSRFANNSG